MAWSGRSGLGFPLRSNEMMEKTKTFESPRLLQNTFAVFFKRRPAIRREANLFEALFEGKYGPPQVLGVPDELDPEIPRIIFSSRHGFSQIVITEVSLSLLVNYSREWQLDRQHARDYLGERVPALFQAAQAVSAGGPSFSGLVSGVRIPLAGDEDVAAVFSRFFLGIPAERGVFDLELKRVRVVDRTYFSNTVLGTYRVWKAGPSASEIGRFPVSGVSERGIQISSDVNDRHAFNEREGYGSTARSTLEVLQCGLSELEAQIDSVLKRDGQ